MTETASLYGPVIDDIPRVGTELRSLAAGHHPLLGAALEYVFVSSGKQIRPALVLLTGKLGRYDLDRLLTLAAAMEVVHTATLVHDDTIDQALTRRGLTTVSELWDSKIAILLGDFLFAQSAYLATKLDDNRLMAMLSETVMAMSSGELRQYASAQARQIDENDYLQRIGEKTASLFAMCCAGAGIVTGQPEPRVEALRSYGRNLGLAFQIADDILDFVGDEATLGKPSGSDLRQGTITLPAILFARSLADDAPLRQDLLHGQNLDDVIVAIKNSGSMDDAMGRAEQYARKAREALDVFPVSDARESLSLLTEQVTHRQK